MSKQALLAATSLLVIVPPETRSVVIVLTCMLTCIYLKRSYTLDNYLVLPTPPPTMISISDYNDSECDLLFRFKKAELLELYKLLRFPYKVRFSNRVTLSGEEIMLRGLYEMNSRDTQYKISRHFGRCWTMQSRAWSFFVDHMYTEHKHLVHDSLHWWYRNNLLQASSKAVWEKIQEKLIKSGKERLTGNDPFNTGLFIDCNCFETSRPGGGPTDEGPESMRWLDEVQRAFYNGWKSMHGLKHQTVDNAFGMTVDMRGPTSLRKHDLTLLRKSAINQRLADIQLGDSPDQQVRIFGDSAYPMMSHLFTYFDDNNYPGLKEYNYGLKSVRISIEWNYAVTAKLFPYVACPSKLRILSTDSVAKVYTVATLLRNFHCALYGQQSANYFRALPPNHGIIFLSKYINQTDF